MGQVAGAAAGGAAGAAGERVEVVTRGVLRLCHVAGSTTAWMMTVMVTQMRRAMSQVGALLSQPCV